MVALAEHSAVAPGQATLTVEMVFQESTVTSATASSPMKLLTPVARGRSVWAYTSSFGGGLVAGDQTRLDLRIGRGARCFVGTQASTKVYRNSGLRPCGHTTHASVEPNAMLVFAPDPVQAFANSSYTQRQEFHLADGAGLVLLDWFSSGRVARGERWAFDRFQGRNEVWRANEPLTPARSPQGREDHPPSRYHSEADHGSASLEAARANHSLFARPGGEGQGEAEQHNKPSPCELLFLDSLLLDSRVPLASPHVVGRFNCFAMLLFIGPPVCDFTASLLAAVNARPVERHAPLITSASPVRDGALLRVAGESVELVARELHQHLKPLATLLGDDPWARKW